VSCSAVTNVRCSSGAQYTLTGPQSLAVGEVAEIIAGISGRPNHR